MESAIFLAHPSSAGSHSRHLCGYLLVKFAAGIWALCLCLPLFAENTISDSLGTIAVPELILEESSDLVAEGILSHLSGTSFYTRYSFPDPLLYHAAKLKNGKVSAIATAVYEEDFLKAKMLLNANNTIYLGNFRPTFGSGMIFRTASKCEGILPPAHPESYVPEGIAVVGKLSMLKLMAIYSSQKRDATFQEGKISSLPRTQRGYLSQTQEDVKAVALSLNTKLINFGNIWYQQEYSDAFSNPELDSLLQVIGGYANLNHGQQRWDIELGWQGGKPSYTGSWKMKMQNFEQHWRYSRYSVWQFPAYSARIQKLSQKDERDEISLELKYKPISCLQIASETTLNRRFGTLSDEAWKAETAVVLSYQDIWRKMRLQLVQIDREILSSIDSTYTNSIPIHYRVNFTVMQQINTSLAFHILARYHHQEKDVSLKTGFWWEQYIAWNTKKWNGRLGVHTGQSQNYTMYIADENGYSSLSGKTMRLFGKGEYCFEKSRLGLSLQQDMRDGKELTGYLYLRF